MEEIITAWWVEIQTIKPRCIYYFGPFETSFEAKATYPGYIDDLDSDGAQGVVIIIRYCKPEILTKCSDNEQF